MVNKPLFGGKKNKKIALDIEIPEGMIPGVFYIRVSTDKQEEKGNGLEAQKESILRFAEQEKIFQIGDFYTETGSGGAVIEKRPILQSAIEKAKQYDAYLVTSKLDRLSRKAAMVTNMLEEKFKFVTVEHGMQPDALLIRIIAAVAQKERELIGERTIAGLKQVKKGYEEEYKKDMEKYKEGIIKEKPKKKRLGIPDVSKAPTHVSHLRRQEGIERSRKYYEEMIKPTIIELKKENKGKNPNREQIAKRMNEKGYKTEYDSEWTVSIIYHNIKRLREEEKRLQKEV